MLLTKHKLNEIKALQQICENEGGFQLKLNFDMLENRTDNQKEDFFHYENEELVGFLGCYRFGDKIELCGMVHPNFRRKGIFTILLNQALEEARQHKISTILLNAPSGSQAAKGFLKTIPCQFSVAEYQMQWHQTDLTEDAQVTIRPSVSKVDEEAEIQLAIAGFGVSEEEARDYQQFTSENSVDQNYIIEAEGTIAGKLRVSVMNGEAWIYGFVVFPHLQGKGIGRKALTNVIISEHQKGLSIFLDVETKNAHALKLYESCGFQSYHSQDYYLYLP